MHVLVTGASGHVASAVLPELIAAGHQVTGLVRSDDGAAAVEKLGAHAIRGDLADLDVLREAAAIADGVRWAGSASTAPVVSCSSRSSRTTSATSSWPPGSSRTG
jgi:uncharacterized protein YbjT (DUF2867 family)